MADARACWRLAWQAIRTLRRIDSDQYARGERLPSAGSCGHTLAMHPREGRAAWHALKARPLDVDPLEERWMFAEVLTYRRVRYARLPLAELEGRCPDCRWPFRPDGCEPGLCSQVVF